MGLVTRDPVLYGELAAYLRDRKIPTVSLLPGQRVPSKVAIVVTSRAEAPKVRFPRVLVADPLDLTALGAALREALVSDDPAQVLWVGIDTGPRPGYAVVRPDGRCLAEGVADSPEAVASLARELRRGFPRAEMIFRVGKGDEIRRDRVLNALVPLKLRVEVAHEERTTQPGRRQNDPLAARAIARTRGEPVLEAAPLRITRGEVGNLQRISREMSGGKFTIPRALATSVLEGSTTLGDAMTETARRAGLPWAEPPPRRTPGRKPSRRSLDGPS